MLVCGFLGMIILHSKNTVRRSSRRESTSDGKKSPRLTRICQNPWHRRYSRRPLSRRREIREQARQQTQRTRSKRWFGESGSWRDEGKSGEGSWGKPQQGPKTWRERILYTEPAGGSERIVCSTSNAVLRPEILDFRLTGWSSISRGKPRDLPSQLSGSPGASWSSGQLYLDEARKRVDLSVTGSPDHALPTLGAKWGV